RADRARRRGAPQPVDPGPGPVVGAARARAGARGQLRPPAGPAVSPRVALQALAARQAGRRLPLRPARGHAGVRAARDLQNVQLTIAPLRVGAIVTACSLPVSRPRMNSTTPPAIAAPPTTNDVSSTMLSRCPPSSSSLKR